MGQFGQTNSVRNRIIRTVAVSLIAITVASCASKSRLTTGSIPKTNTPIEAMSESQLRSASDQAGKAYERNPKNPDVGMHYASILMRSGRGAQALAVMQQVAIHNPNNKTVLAAYGKSQAAAGQLQPALETIRRAQTPDRPDWKLLSAEGAILDQLGRSREARVKYRDALDLNPNESSIHSNLGMSYLLGEDLRTAETYLKKAAQLDQRDSRVRQNLALVVGLQGRFDEAEKIARAELSPEQAEANVQYLKSILSQQNAWKRLSNDDSTATN